jgi:hypothetical protein
MRTNLYAVALGLSLCALSAPAWAAEAPPFANSCLIGRYAMATTGWDVTNNFPPGTPFAITAYVQTKCTSPGNGTYIGRLFATYPGVTPSPVCEITEGTYKINPVSGVIWSTATLADATAGSCAAFGNKTLAEFGVLSDPTAKQFYQVETGQGGGDTIHYIWTKQP